MASSDLYDLVIIGGGPGGFTAGIYAKRAVLKTVLLEKGPIGGQMNLTEMVENWPGIERIPGMELSERFLAHARSYGLEVISQEVTAVEPGMDHHTVRLADNSIIHTHAVIIATGGSPRKLNIPGEKEYYGKGVSYCAVCDGFFFRNKTVVVVGGGDSATEESLYLAKLADKVYLVHRRDTMRAGMILQDVLPQLEMDIQAVCIKGVWGAVLSPFGLIGSWARNRFFFLSSRAFSSFRSRSLNISWSLPFSLSTGAI